jgi:hypothetical protein
LNWLICQLKKSWHTPQAIVTTKLVATKKIGIDMSKMSELSFEIADMLEAGYLPVTIARNLEIPVSWVYETSDTVDTDSEELSPFETINS